MLDVPAYAGGGSLLGINAVGTLSAWVEFASGFVLRASILGSFSMPLAGRRRRLLAKIENEEMQALPRFVSVCVLVYACRHGTARHGVPDGIAIAAARALDALQ